MFPILPILILLLLGPANAERLADEGLLPAVLLAVHRTMAPAVGVAVAQVEEEAVGTAEYHSASSPPWTLTLTLGTPPLMVRGVFLPACPPRAGPRIA